MSLCHRLAELDARLRVEQESPPLLRLPSSLIDELRALAVEHEMELHGINKVLGLLFHRPSRQWVLQVMLAEPLPPHQRALAWARALLLANPNKNADAPPESASQTRDRSAASLAANFRRLLLDGEFGAPSSADGELERTLATLLEDAGFGRRRSSSNAGDAGELLEHANLLYIATELVESTGPRRL